MAKITAPVVQYGACVPISCSKNLGVTQVYGYQVVVNMQYLQDNGIGEGALAVYVPVGAVSDGSCGLVSAITSPLKAKAFYGVTSEGLLLPWVDVLSYLQSKGFSAGAIQKLAVLGKDVAPVLGLYKPLPPVCGVTGGGAQGGPAGFNKYTSLEHYKRYPNVLVVGEEVIVTEKLHGTSARYGLIDGQWCIGTKRTFMGPSLASLQGQNVWQVVWHTHNMHDKLQTLQGMFKGANVAIYGEIVGANIQNLAYGHVQPQLYVYDIAVDGNYLPWYVYEGVCTRDVVGNLGLLNVPFIYKGPWYPQQLLGLAEGDTLLNNGACMREGFVVEPATPRWHPDVGRVKLKVVGQQYLIAQGKGRLTDTDIG